MNLIKFLKESGEARKVFGDRELKIIEKQLLGVELTQSEKNRLSRDIRKKFEFAIKAARFGDELRLKKGSEIKKIIEETVLIILADPLRKRIKSILLYGSAADKKLHLNSDIDIAVNFGTIDLKEVTTFRKRVSGKVNKRVDVQVYNRLPAKIRKEIDLKGRLLHPR